MGHETNYDKLDLQIWTDGTLDGEAAVSMAAGIIRGQFAPFQLLGRVEAVLEPERARMYLENYFSKGADISIYWGNAEDFLKDLLQRWSESPR